MALTISPVDIVAAAEESGSPGLLARHTTWERVALGSVANILNGYPFKSSSFNNKGIGVPLIRIRDVGREATATYYSGDYEDQYLVRPGELVVGMDGDFRVAVWHGPTALLNQRVCKVSVRNTAHYNERFLLYVLQGYLEAIGAATSSVTVKHLSSRSLEQIPLPLPPFAEQCRIAEELDDHASRLDAADASIRRCGMRTRHLWEAALTSLTQKTRRKGRESFDILRVSDVADVAGGIQKQAKRVPANNSFPFLRVANVARGRLDLSEIHEIELFDGELERYRLVSGDLLVVEGNGSPDQIGRAATWRGQIANAVHQNHLIRVRPGQRLIPRYLELVWNSPFVVDQLRKVARSTSGLYTLSTSKIKVIQIPVPSIEEQKGLIAEADAWETSALTAGNLLESAAARSRSLRHAILGRAFTGMLVPQGLDDEPASMLLERIRADGNPKSELPKRTSRRGRKTKSAKELPPPPSTSRIPSGAIQQELPL